MSIDKLQKAIRKAKNPLMVAFPADSRQIPPQYRGEPGSEIANLVAYIKELLQSLRETIPAVRFDFATYSVLGTQGMSALSELLRFADKQGYYVLLDVPEMHSPRQAELVAKGVFEQWRFDGLYISCYMGTDVLSPFVKMICENEKDLFVAVRTGNKSASELQDLLAGTRLVHTAAADMAKRLGEGITDRCGYSRVGAVGPATSADALQNLRKKYENIFLLVDGLDYPGANAKICAEAFDQLGHGAIACVSAYVTGAWQNPDGAGENPVTLAIRAVERLKKNINRYVTIL